MKPLLSELWTIMNTEDKWKMNKEFFEALALLEKEKYLLKQSK